MNKRHADAGTGRHALQRVWRLGHWATVVFIVASLVSNTFPVQAGEATGRVAIDGLPVVELPAAGGRNDTLAIILSGDGGWADLDKSFGEAFQRQGLSTVGVDCLRYFWKTRQPAEVSQMLERVIRHYLHAWNKKSVLLVGYSFGACWLPFLVNRLPADLLAQIDLCVLLSPSNFVNVEIHVMDWMSDVRRPGALDVLPEALKITKPLLCVYGTEEDDAICPHLKESNVSRLAMPGGHHYNAHYAPVLEAIFKKLAVLEPQAARQDPNWSPRSTN